MKSLNFILKNYGPAHRSKMLNESYEQTTSRTLRQSTTVRLFKSSDEERILKAAGEKHFK